MSSPQRALTRTEPEGPGDPGASPAPAASSEEAPTPAEVASVWRLLRRLGVPEYEVDDVTQEVFLVAARRRGSIEPGKSRAFAYGVALRVAREAARRARRRPEALDESTATHSDGPAIEELIDRYQARALLDAVLSQMPYDLRAVFVLFEIEDLSTYEIASALELPRGTVASRLRRARQDFERRVSRLRARLPRRDSHG